MDFDTLKIWAVNALVVVLVAAAWWLWRDYTVTFKFAEQQSVIFWAGMTAVAGFAYWLRARLLS